MKTKICQACNKEFKQRIKIDGKFINLQRRKLCLECSPFGTHNTKSLKHFTKNTNGTFNKICRLCSKSLQFNKNNFHTRKDGYLRYVCKSCWNDKTAEAQRSLKKKCIQYHGGQCKICGYSKYAGALEFHHIDPNTKDFIIAGKLRSWKKIKNELDKCVMLCSNCHRETHAGLHLEYIITN